MGVGIATEIVKTCDHFVLQSLINDVLPPEVAHPILNPLKIRDRHPASVRQDVGNYKNALLVENLIRRSGRRSIRAFRKNLTFDSVRVLGVDLVLSRSGDEHVTLELE